MEQSFGAGGKSPGGGGRSPNMATTPRGRSATPGRDGGYSPGGASPGGGSVSPGGNGEMMIHPSHRGTNYMRKPPKKKKKKRKKPKSPQGGMYTTLALPEDQRGQRMMVNPDDPYYRGADLANGYSPGGVVMDPKGKSGRKGFDEGYWRDGTAAGDGTPA